jgi:hypothetical protein
MSRRDVERWSRNEQHDTMTKYIKIVISKSGKALYYRGDGFWFGRCSESFAKQKMAEGVSVWSANMNPALISGVIAG